MNLLESLGSSPLVLTWEDYYYGIMSIGSWPSSNISPGDTFTGEATLPGGMRLLLITGANFPVNVIAVVTTGGAFSFPAPNLGGGETLELIVHNEDAPWNSMMYGPGSVTLTWDAPEPPDPAGECFWTAMVETEEVGCGAEPEPEPAELCVGAVFGGSSPSPNMYGNVSVSDCDGGIPPCIADASAIVVYGAVSGTLTRDDDETPGASFKNDGDGGLIYTGEHCGENMPVYADICGETYEVSVLAYDPWCH